MIPEKVLCSACEGTGDWKGLTCSKCEGAGRIKPERCKLCFGEGFVFDGIEKLHCPDCGGVGYRD